MNEQWLVYTTEEGGEFQVYGRVTRDEFETITLTRQLLSRNFTFADGEPQIIVPAYVMLLNEEANFDFILGRPR